MKKTSDIDFKKYGKVYNKPINLETHKMSCHQIIDTNKTISYLFRFDQDVYIELYNGIACLMIGLEPKNHKLELYTLGSQVKIKAGCYFNVIPISKTISCYLLTPTNLKYQTFDIKPYEYNAITPKIHVYEILGHYYGIKAPKYHFKGEQHSYYELTYVDYGTLETNVNEQSYQLHSHEFMIYGPHQFHTQTITTDQSCSYLTILFHMDIDNDQSLLNEVFHCTNDVYTTFKKFMKHSSSDLPYSKTLMLCYLQEIIALTLQSRIDIQVNEPCKMIGNTAIHYHQNELLCKILEYMNDKVCEPLTIEEVCHHFSISRSLLQSLFKTNMHVSPKNYLSNIKLTKSKEMILENKYTISEIAFTLGFSSIHYFSRLFKQHFHIPPSEYAKKIYHDNEK